MDWLRTDTLDEELARLGPATHDDEPAEAGPMMWPLGYHLDDRGLSYSTGDDRPPLQLSGPLTVRGLARDPQGNGWAVALSWEDLDGVSHRAMLDQGALIGDGTDVLRPLVSGGLQIAHDPKRVRLFKAALGGLRCRKRVLLIRRCGWHESVFVLPHKVIGRLADPNEQVVFDGEAGAARYAMAGTLEEWIDRVARPSTGNSRLVFALAVGFAGPLNDLLQGEGGGVHLVGGSSLGKSTALIVGGSVWGGGGRAGFAQTWRATDNGLESVAKAHSGTLLVLDELGELGAHEAGRVAYMLANGQSKIRATREAATRARSEWRVMILSAGEVGLADKIAESGQRARAGQLVRLVDVPADAEAGQGLFEDTGSMNAAVFATALKGAALQAYGTAGPTFVEKLVADPEGTVGEAREMVRAITSKLLPEDRTADGQLMRVAERFALIAAAGELARRYLDLPWTEGEATRAAQACFMAWRASRGGDGPAEVTGAIRALREAVERHGEGRFRNLERLNSETAGPFTAGPIRDLLGYRFKHKGEWVWGLTASGWSEILAGVGQTGVIARALLERGVLVTNGKERTPRLVKKVDDRTIGLYVVRDEALRADEADSTPIDGTDGKSV